MNHIFDSTAELIWTILAMVGGTARALDKYVRTGVAPGLSLLFANALVSGFSGYMVAQVVIKFQPDWALVGAGVGGYLGTQGLDWLASIMATKFGGTIDPKDKRYDTPVPEEKKETPK